MKLNYECLGKDFTDRQRIKRQRKNIVQKLRPINIKGGNQRFKNRRFILMVSFYCILINTYKRAISALSGIV